MLLLWPKEGKVTVPASPLIIFLQHRQQNFFQYNDVISQLSLLETIKTLNHVMFANFTSYMCSSNVDSNDVDDEGDG